MVGKGAHLNGLGFELTCLRGGGESSRGETKRREQRRREEQRREE